MQAKNVKGYLAKHTHSRNRVFGRNSGIPTCASHLLFLFAVRDDRLFNLEHLDKFVPRFIVQAKDRLVLLYALFLGFTGGEWRGRICPIISVLSTCYVERYSRRVGKSRLSVDTPTVPSRTRKLT